MSEKKELNNEELEKVTGGCIGTEDPHYANFSGYVNMYSLEENKEYYFTEKRVGSGGAISWFRAIVKRTWEKKVGIFTTERTHKVQITEKGTLPSGWDVGDTWEINGDTIAVYTTKIN